jgi:hypothetical protein
LLFTSENVARTHPVELNDRPVQSPGPVTSEFAFGLLRVMLPFSRGIAIKTAAALQEPKAQRAAVSTLGRITVKLLQINELSPEKSINPSLIRDMRTKNSA